MFNNSPHNITYIDGQNLYMGTAHADTPWKVDYKRLRRYLYERHKVIEAYYFIGAYESKMEKLYVGLENAGYIVKFRPHSEEMSSYKKGNVDTDITFNMMRDFHDGKFVDDKAILVSGDGDYIQLVQYLIEQNALDHVLLPNYHKASSLYKLINTSYRDYLDKREIKEKIRLAEK